MWHRSVNRKPFSSNSSLKWSNLLRGTAARRKVWTVTRNEVVRTRCHERAEFTSNYSRFISDYSRIMVDAHMFLLFLKLCRHNEHKPSLYTFKASEKFVVRLREVMDKKHLEKKAR